MSVAYKRPCSKPVKNKVITMPGCIALFLLILIGANAQADSRENFVQNVLPKKYPQLVRFLKNNGSFPVTWISQTGERQTQTVDLSEAGRLTIKTKIYGGPSSDMDTPVYVTMVDSDQDAKLDYIEYSTQGQEPHGIDLPKDEDSLLLWEIALAITMKYSNCCR